MNEIREGEYFIDEFDGDLCSWHSQNECLKIAAFNVAVPFSERQRICAVLNIAAAAAIRGGKP